MRFWKNLLSPGNVPSHLPCSAVIVAAGQASRMEGIDKILCPIGEVPVILRSLHPFQDFDRVEEIVLVTSEERMVELGNLCRNAGITKVKRIVKGGETRTDSVLNGVNAVSKGPRLIAIHDGARPFVTEEILSEVIDTAEKTSAAAPAIPVKDTIKRAENGVVSETPDRDALFAVQTPQVFDADLIRAALVKAQEDDVAITDDCSAVERLGFPVHLTKGSEQNIKITTPNDLLIAGAILAEREE